MTSPFLFFETRLGARSGPSPRLARLVTGLLVLVALLLGNAGPMAAGAPRGVAQIEVNAGQVTGNVQPFLFGHFIEHEYNTIQGGLWAELLRARKFEEGDQSGDGVADAWQPEERIQDRYWQLVAARGPNVRYFVDHGEYYGGGASQAIELYGSGQNHASVYQVGLQVARGRRYAFYVYLKARGTGKAWVEFDKLGGPLFARQEFDRLSDGWEKYTAEFTSPEDTSEARLRIGFQGAGTFWMDSASLMPADNLRGLRRDVVEALRPLRVLILRFPGGCFADYYHWKLGVGPRDRRPEFWGEAWSEWNPNDFGTDEYMGLARELGFEGHITTNYLSATAQEAAEWVEYANGPAGTPMGRLRSENGHAEPYAIKYWAVGNEAPTLCAEQYTGGTKLSDYAKRFREYEGAMRRVDPSIRLMASSVGQPNWVRDLLGLLPVDLLATSIYTGEYENQLSTRLADLDRYYRQVVAEPQVFARKLAANIQAAGERLPRDHPFFAITEYNSWWLSEKVDPDYRLGTALYFAGVFNTLLRHAREVFMAEVSTTLNVQGIVGINPVAIKLTPPYFAFLLYRNHIGSRVLETRAESPPASFNPELPALDAVATLSEKGDRLCLAVVNRSEQEDILTSVQLNGWAPESGSPARAWELNGKDKVAANPFGSTENVNIRERPVTQQGAAFTYRFPAHSVTVLEFSGTPFGH